jgi:thiamine biosynthesis protein ThiS
MKITVNGQVMDVTEGLTLERLLRELSVRMEYTAVALNHEVTQKSTYAETILRENDRVEIVHPMGGG